MNEARAGEIILARLILMFVSLPVIYLGDYLISLGAYVIGLLIVISGAFMLTCALTAKLEVPPN